MFFRWALLQRRPDISPVERLSDLTTEVLPRRQPGSLGWFKLSAAAISLSLATLGGNSRPEQTTEAVRSAQAEINDPMPFVSPLLNRQIWASLQISCLATLAKLGATDAPDDVLRFAEHAFTITAVPYFSEWDATIAAYARASVSGAEDKTLRKSLAWINDTLHLGMDLTPTKPRCLASPQALSAGEIVGLAQHLEHVWESGAQV